MRRAASVLSVVSSAVAFGLLAAMPSAAAAQVRLPTGSNAYVRLVHLPGGGLTAALTPRGRKRLGRKLRGNVLDGSCTKVGKVVQGSSFSLGESDHEFEVGPGHRVRYVFFLDRRADFCDIGLAHVTITRRGGRVRAVPGRPFDSIALTQKGARYLDADRVTAHLDQVLTIAFFLANGDPHGHFPSATTITSAFAHTRLRVVTLRSPTDTPPAGEVGVFSDGLNHCETVGTTRVGQRLFIDSNNGTLSTNSSDHLFRFVGGQVATLIAN